MRQFTQRVCEKFLRKIGLFIDIFRLRHKNFSIICIAIYYTAFYITTVVFLLSLSQTLTILTHPSINDKELILRTAVENFRSRNASETIERYPLEVKIRNYSSFAPKQLVYHYHLRLISSEPNDSPVVLKNRDRIASHSFPTNFYILDISAKKQGIFMESIELSREIIWTKEVLANRSRTFCVEVLYRKPLSAPHSDPKLLTVKRQRFCDPLSSNSARGIRVSLFKFDEVKLFNTECESKTHCRELCLSSGLFYLEDTYVEDKLLSVITCQRPYFCQEICLVVRYDPVTDSLVYEGGCYGGVIENFKPVENLDTKLEFNKTLFYIRDPTDPYLFSLDKENEVYEFSSVLIVWAVKRTLVLLLVWILLVLWGGFGDRLRKFRWRCRFGKKEIELEGFNQHEMSSATIKL